MAAVGILTIEMAANVARIQKDMEHARKSVDGAMAKIRQSAALAAKALGAIGIGLSVAALTGFIRGAINAADGMAKMAQKTGLTVEELAGVQLAFRQSGAEAASFQMGMARLTVAISEGNKHFNQMGLSTKNADGSLKSTRQMLGEVADKFASYQDGAAKAALAIKLFGRSGAELLPLLNGGAQGLADYDEKARTLGLTLDTSTAKAAERFNDTLDLAGQGLQGIARQVAARLLPTLESLAGNFISTATSGDTLKITVDTIAAGLRSMVTAALVGVTAIKAVFRAVEMANKSKAVWNELTQEFEVVNEGWGTFKDSIIADWEELNTRLKSVWSGGGGETINQMTGALGKQSPVLADMDAATAKLTETEKARLALVKEGEALTKSLMTDEEKRIASQNRATELLRAHVITVDTYQRALASLVPEAKAAAAEVDKFGELLEKFDQLNSSDSAWADSLTDGLGDAVKSLERMNVEYDRLGEKAALLAQLQKEAAAETDPGKQASMLAQVEDKKIAYLRDSVSTQLGMYANMFGVLGQLYDEDSKERRRLNEAEKAFAVAQIAIQAQQAITSAVASIASAGTGDPYTAIPRVLAMAALMAGVLGSAGIAFSGGGGGGSAAAAAAPQGSGTVLGDASAQSQSISRSYEMMENWHVDEYAALRGIWDEMKDLNTNITGLVSGMVRNLAVGDGVKLPADTLGAAEKYWNQLADFNQKTFNWLAAPLETGLNKLGESLFGKDSILGQIFILPDKILGGVLGWIGKGISSIFGGGTSYKLMESGVHLGEISVEALQSGVDTAVQEYAYIRKKTDGGMFGSTKRKYYYRYGEVDDEITGLFTQVYAGLSDTIVSLTAGLGGDMEKAMAYVFSAEHINLKGMDAGEIHETISAVISTAGDTAAKEVLGDIILRYQKIDEGLLETAVRLYSTQEVVRSILTQSGQEIADNLLEISQALVMFAGDLETLQENYATYYDKFFTEQERFRHQYEYMAAALADLNLEFPESREGFRALVEAQDVTTEAGQRAYVALLDLAGVADELATTVEETAAKRREFELQIMELTGREVEALAIRRQMELNAMDKSLHFMQRRVWQLQDEQKALSEVTDARATYRTEVERKLSEATASQSELENALATAQGRLESARAQAIQRGIQTESDLWNTALRSAQQRISKWRAIVDSLSQYQAGMLTGPNTYLLPDQILAEARRQFAVSTDADLPAAADTLLSAARDALTDPAAYREIFEQVQGKISGSLSYAERQLRAAERSAAAADRQLEALSTQMELTREANDLAAAQAEYAAAKKALDEYQYTEEIAYWQAELDRLDALTAAQDSMTAALGRYSSALVSAISGGYDDLTRRFADELAALEANPGYADGGISTGPSSGYLATLHGTEAVIPLRNGSVPVQMQGGGDPETKALLRGLLAEIREDKELNRKVHRILDRVTGGEDSLQTRAAS